ncbi:hypothetical protein KCU93_g2733, partial [Aureobasidium melanogenum]
MVLQDLGIAAFLNAEEVHLDVFLGVITGNMLSSIHVAALILIAAVILAVVFLLLGITKRFVLLFRAETMAPTAPSTLLHSCESRRHAWCNTNGPKRQRVTQGPKKPKKTVVDSPSDPSIAHSFKVCHEVENKTAAYLGFDFVSELRHLVNFVKNKRLAAILRRMEGSITALPGLSEDENGKRQTEAVKQFTAALKDFTQFARLKPAELGKLAMP